MLKPISLIVQISVFQLLSTCTAVEVLKKQSHFSKGQLMLGPYSFKEGNLVYALCDHQEPNVKCQVVQERPPYKETFRSCNITLIPQQKNGEIQSSIGVAALGKDRVILFWHETGAEEYLKIDTIKMDHRCQIYEAKVAKVSLPTYIELHHTNDILTYNDDTYDVIFQDVNRCGDKMCKMSINAEGEVIAEPTGYISSNKQFISFVSPIATRSSSKGFVYTRIDADESTLWIIKSDGKEKQLTKYKKSAISAVSAINNIITSCIKPDMNTSMTCTQYDEDGKMKFTTNVTSIDEKTQILRVYSLAKGGFLMMTAKCETGICSNAASGQIIRVDANGVEAGTFRLVDFESAIVERHWAHIYENGEEKYCAAFIGEKRAQGQMEYLNVVVNCFNKADFQQ
ncbi:uncharacterized protein LOC131669893 isoform X2 [Phymastichus coffea]|uniref:uncharacterized protein LOC131669893 isoform X2 n=1 Tax=Phymastichus coffea TaxID=108790 RepID=UPI00273C2300|nr:uncharacterized protein LOC131669893 isoform X2 [Phymastichus coffea]